LIENICAKAVLLSDRATLYKSKKAEKFYQNNRMIAKIIILSQLLQIGTQLDIVGKSTREKLECIK